MEKRRFESFQVFSCLKKSQPWDFVDFQNIVLLKNGEKYRGHTLSIR